jgi:hypothetical protein
MAGQRQPQYRDAAQALVGGFVQGITEDHISQAIMAIVDAYIQKRGYAYRHVEK